jgi:hypothetical protein
VVKLQSGASSAPAPPDGGGRSVLPQAAARQVRPRKEVALDEDRGMGLADEDSGVAEGLLRRRGGRAPGDERHSGGHQRSPATLRTIDIMTWRFSHSARQTRDGWPAPRCRRSTAPDRLPAASCSPARCRPRSLGEGRRSFGQGRSALRGARAGAADTLSSATLAAQPGNRAPSARLAAAACEPVEAKRNADIGIRIASIQEGRCSASALLGQFWVIEQRRVSGSS